MKDSFRKKHIKLLFALTIIVFIILWSYIFLPWFVNYLSINPNFAGAWSIPAAFGIKIFGYFAAFLMIGWILTGEKYALRVGLAGLLLYEIFVIVTPPTCIGTNGQLLLGGTNITYSPNFVTQIPSNIGIITNGSCISGDDTFVAWLLNWLAIPMQYLTNFFIMIINGIISLINIFGASLHLMTSITLGQAEFYVAYGAGPLLFLAVMLSLLNKKQLGAAIKDTFTTS